MKVDRDRIDRPDKCDRCGAKIGEGWIGKLGGKSVMIDGEPKMLCENCLETAYKYGEVEKVETEVEKQLEDTIELTEKQKEGKKERVEAKTRVKK